MSFEDISITVSDNDECTSTGGRDLYLSHKELTDEMQRSEHSFTNRKEQRKVLFDFIKSKLCIDDIQTEQIKAELLKKITYFLAKAITKYIASSRTYERFVRNNQIFLEKNFEVPKVSHSSKLNPKPTKRLLPLNILFCV